MHSLVIGGTKGIGSIIAARLAQNNNTVCIINRSVQEPLLNIYKCDISNTKKTLQTLNSIYKKKGLINNLIFCQRFRGEGDSWEGEISTSLSATRQIIDWYSKQKAEENSLRSIVIINSIASKLIVSEQPVSYHVVKSALLGLMRYYAVMLGHLNIRVNSVSPGTTIKPESKKFYEENEKLQSLYKQIIPLGRIGTSDDIANMIKFLCSNESSFITGQDFIVDGGLSLRGVESLTRKLLKI